MDGDAILESELNPTTPQGDSSGPQPDTNDTGGFASKVSGFIKGNKGKIGGIAGFGGISVILMMFSVLLAGPMQIVHAGQVIGEVIDTARDITSGIRTARVVAKAGKATSAAKSTRLGLFSEILTKNFEKKLAKETGVKIVNGALTVTEGSTTKISSEALAKLLDSRGNLSTKESKKLLSTVIDGMEGNSIYKHIMKRNLNKMYGYNWYGGIKKAMSGVFDNVAEGTVKTLEKWVSRKQVQNGEVIMKYSDEAGKAIVNAGKKAGDDIALGVLSKFGKKVVGKVTTVIKGFPIIGTAIGIAIDFAIDQYFDREKVQGILAASMTKSGEIATAAEDIRNNTVPTEDEAGNPVSPMSYAEMIVTQNLYRTSENVASSDVASLLDNTAYAIDNTCPSVNVGDFDISTDEGKEAYDAAKSEAASCVASLLDPTEEALNSMPTTSKIGSSFFSNTPLKAEFDPNFSAAEGTAEYYRGVSPLITGNVGVDKTIPNLANAVVSSFIFIGPKDVLDWVEEDFDPETLRPSYIGGTSMYGARVQQNDLSASEGAKNLSKSEEASLLRETQTHLAEKQMEKSLFARLFDVEDYHSGIATLSRDAEWDLSNSSPTTHLANVAKTFAAIPKLIGKSLGTYTRAASAASPTPYNYGFGLVAYTSDQVYAEPDYWDAEKFLMDDTNFDQNLNKNELKDCTGATITKGSDGIKVEWGESKVYKEELGNGKKCKSYYDGGGTFDSHNAADEANIYSGDDAVRTILANYKTMAAFAATSFDELNDSEKDEALSEAGVSKENAEQTLIGAMKDMGVVYPGGKTNGNNNVTPSTGWAWPVADMSIPITDVFGWSDWRGRVHEGIDIGASLETPALSIGNGTVVFAQWNGNYGNNVIVDLGNGYKAFYAHLNSMSVSEGQTVKQGDKVGGIGGTGGYPVHLHFEIWENESPVDPLPFYSELESQFTWCLEC